MRDFTLRLSLFYGASFTLVGFFLPFFPVWLKSEKLNPEEISAILAAPLFVRLIFTPAISFVSDRYGDHKRTIQILSLGSLLSLVLMFWSQGFIQILLVSALFSIFWTTIMPLTETLAMSGVRKAGLDYGRMRLWGSLAFIVASTLGGITIKQYGAPSALWLFAFAAVLICLISCILPKAEARPEQSEGSRGGIRLRDVLVIIRSPVFLLFLIGASAIQTTHSIYYSFGSIHWQGQGISDDVIGMLWSIGVIAETVLFAFSRGPVRYLGATGLLLLGAAGAVVRWGIMAFDPSLAVLVPLQVLHALTFGAGHLGAVLFIGAVVPEKYSGTAQGLYAAFSMGLIMGIAILASGPLYDVLKGGAYLAMAGVGAGACILVLVLMKIWDGGTIYRIPEPDPKPAVI